MSYTSSREMLAVYTEDGRHFSNGNGVVGGPALVRYTRIHTAQVPGEQARPFLLQEWVGLLNSRQLFQGRLEVLKRQADFSLIRKSARVNTDL